MASYTPVEADDIAETGAAEGLEFKSFLPEDASSKAQAGTNGIPSSANVDRGYLNDRPQQRSGFWTIECYQKYFDVDTKTVIQRCIQTLVPTPPNAGAVYVSKYLNPTPDLYGPFWTLTTVIFCLFVFSSLASSISSYLSDKPVTYDFQLLSIAVTLIYAYGLGIPTLLWFALRYLGVTDWDLVEAIAVWGYGQFVWIPVSMLCLIPVPLVRWILVGIAFGLSGYFLTINIYPILSMAEAKATRSIIVVIVVLHAALALTLKVLFFSYYVTKEIGVKDPLGDDGTGPSR